MCAFIFSKFPREPGSVLAMSPRVTMYSILYHDKCIHPNIVYILCPSIQHPQGLVPHIFSLLLWICGFFQQFYEGLNPFLPYTPLGGLLWNLTVLTFWWLGREGTVQGREVSRLSLSKVDCSVEQRGPDHLCRPKAFRRLSELRFLNSLTQISLP
jgi:hypothetical protein